MIPAPGGNSEASVPGVAMFGRLLRWTVFFSMVMRFAPGRSSNRNGKMKTPTPTVLLRISFFVRTMSSLFETSMPITLPSTTVLVTRTFSEVSTQTPASADPEARLRVIVPFFDSVGKMP
jgi:hypothetical protein